MAHALSARQTELLKILINEYIETAVPVGSQNLDKKYNLGVSPATIRNEMAALTKLGYLRQPHTSAGRTPSPLAMKFYIDQLMEEKQMSLADEVKAKEDVWDVRDDFEDLIDEATHALAERTKSLSFAATEDGKSWHAGESYIFSCPEFSDIRSCASLFTLLEEAQRMREILFVRSQGISPIEVLFGEEFGWPEIPPIGVVTTHFRFKGRNGALSVIGPTRQSYATVIPVLRYFKNLIEEATKDYESRTKIG